MKVCLITTYELGHQPFGIASPARWLEDAGAEVTCIDLAVDCLNEDAVRQAELIAIYLPMHTATRLAAAALPKIRALNAGAHLAFYGLYATVNMAYLRELGGQTMLAGEVEPSLVRLYQQLAQGAGTQGGDGVALSKQRFRVPTRSGLPDLSRYATLNMGDGRMKTVGYTEATRGCKHLCRHCPVVPVYHGRFFVVGRDVVLADVRQQVDAGAQHVTFGDPDFFNGPGHAMRLVEAFHAEFPNVTYDATIKVEHLLAHPDKLRRLAETGCLFVTTAVEEVDDAVLAKLDKGHTRADFVEVVEAARVAGLTLSPTFIPFHPWTTPAGFLDLLTLLAELDLIENVAPVQLAIRLLIPQGSRILELAEMEDYLGGFDAEKLSYAWTPADPRADDLQAKVCEAVQQGEREGVGRRAIFQRVWDLAHAACGRTAPALPPARADSHPVPAMSEPWYCCAEPTVEQLARV
jgi:radical SAM superfamily enzyme YgiQ (UPF0313 family)